MKLVRNGSFVSRREALVRRVSLMLRRFGMKWEFLTLKLVWLLYTNDNGICSLDPYAMYLPCSLHRIHVPPLRHDCHYPQWHCRNGTLLIYFQFYYLEGWLVFVRLGQGILRMCDNWQECLVEVDTIFVFILSSCNYINVTKLGFPMHLSSL